MPPLSSNSEDSDRFSSRASKKNTPSHLSSVKGGESARKSGGRRSKRVFHDGNFRSSTSTETFSSFDLASPSDVEPSTSTLSSEEQTSKKNHTQATMDKYKELYLAILSDPENARLFQESCDKLVGAPASPASPHDDVTTIFSNSTSVKDAPGKANALSDSGASFHIPSSKKDAGSDDRSRRKLSVDIDQQLSDSSTQSTPTRTGLKIGESLLTEHTGDALVSSKKRKKKTASSSNRTPAIESDRPLIRISSKDMKIQAGAALGSGELSVSTRSISSITSDLSELKPTKRSDVKRKEAEKRLSASQKSRLGSRSPSRRSRKCSQDDASISSQRSSRSNRSTSCHRSSSTGHSKRLPSSHKDEFVPDDNDDWEAASGEKKEKKGLFCKIKRFAGGVKKSLGLQGVHKFKLGEKARYKMSRAKVSLETFDPITNTAEVEVVGIHIDAVLEIPFYTILFDDGSRKQTNWEKLVPLADWDQKGKADFDSTTFQEKPRGNLRFRSWSRSRRLSWGVRDDEADDDKSTSSYRSSRSARSTSSHRSSSSHRSARSSGSSRKKPRQRERSGSPVRHKGNDGRDRDHRRSTRRHPPRSKTPERPLFHIEHPSRSDKEKRKPRRSRRPSRG